MSYRVALIDAGVGNLFNAERALCELGLGVEWVSDPAALCAADAIVFPGVAHFGFLANALRERGLDDALRSAIAAGVPYLGICAGMHVLFEGSDEAPHARGLGVFAGRVRRVAGPRSPHMGWNYVRWQSLEQNQDGWAYFAHAYAPPAEADGTVAHTTYGNAFAAACKRGNVLGVQFHPERSSRYGASLLRRFFEGTGAAGAR